jgi:hypothetical protein
MAKIKISLLILFTFVITYFIIENSILAPPIKLFGKEIIQLYTSFIILISFCLGLLFGWLGHVSWRRSRRRENAATASREQKVPEPQSPQQQEEKQE